MKDVGGQKRSRVLGVSAASLLYEGTFHGTCVLWLEGVPYRSRTASHLLTCLCGGTSPPGRGCCQGGRSWGRGAQEGGVERPWGPDAASRIRNGCLLLPGNTKRKAKQQKTNDKVWVGGAPVWNPLQVQDTPVLRSPGSHCEAGAIIPTSPADTLRAGSPPAMGSRLGPDRASPPGQL